MPELELEVWTEVHSDLGPNQIDLCPNRTESNWTVLPSELWIIILVDYGMTAKDLAHLDCCCKLFSNQWQGLSLTEESARLIIKKRKEGFFGEFTYKMLLSSSWKETLHTLETIDGNMHKIAAGSYQNIFTVNGNLLTWGAGRFGQLGTGSRDDSVQLQNIRSLIPAGSGDPVQVSAGCGHSGFVTTKGHAFTCGDNRYSQLGHYDFKGQTCPVPTRVQKGLIDKKCLQIACGSSHTMFLTDTGNVYVAGLGDSGQLGLGCGKAIAPDPTLIPFQYEDYTIVQITAGIAHNIFTTRCGRVFTFGLGSTGQLGHGGTKNIGKPTLVSVLRKCAIRYAAAGVSHSIFLDAKGRVYTCGNGHNGLLGHGDTRIRTLPSQVASLEGVKIVSAAAGVSQSIFISEIGDGYWCGEGMGEMKNETATTPTMMRLPEPLARASIGNSHTILLMWSGLLMSIGNNGRLQTGIPTPQNHSTPVIASYSYIQ